MSKSRAAISWRARYSGLPPSRMSTPRPAMFVATVDRALASGLRHDHGFLLVVLRVQHVVLDAATVEHAGEQLRLLDRHRADQDRLPVLVALHDVLERARSTSLPRS